MLFLFKNFCQKYPKLSNHLGDLSLFAVGMTAATLATQSIKDPEKRDVAWDNFLDEDGYKRELALREKRKLSP